MRRKTGLRFIIFTLFFLLALPVYSTGKAEAACPAPTVADTAGIAAGKFPQQYELDEFEKLTGCKASFSENPIIGKLNKELNGEKPL